MNPKNVFVLVEPIVGERFNLRIKAINRFTVSADKVHVVLTNGEHYTLKDHNRELSDLLIAALD